MSNFCARHVLFTGLVGVGFAGLLASAAGCSSNSNKGGTGGKIGTGGAAGGQTATGGHDGGSTDDGSVGDSNLGDRSPGDAVGDAGAGLVQLNFTNGTENFVIDRFPNATPFNLGALTVDGGTVVTLDFDPAVGMPAPGSVRITSTFTDYDQEVAASVVYPRTATINLVGKTITAQIRLDPDADGGATTFTGVARLFALSTPVAADAGPGYFLAEGARVTLTNNWQSMSLSLVTPDFSDPTFNAADIVQVGLHIVTPSPITGDAARPPFGAPQTISIHFDSEVSN